MSDQVTALPDDLELCIDCGAERRLVSYVPPLSLTVHADAHGRHTMITASGEIDFDNSPALGQVVQDALDQSADGVDIDLAEIAFCDCSGLDILLHVRRSAREAAKTLTVRTPSPAVLRLLQLTGTVDVFTMTDSAPTLDTGDVEDIKAENSQLRRAMRTRPAIDIARGMLMASYSISAEQAWNVLVSTSQNSNTKLYLLAETLMNTVHGENVPESVASHLTQALQQHGSQPL